MSSRVFPQDFSLESAEMVEGMPSDWGLIRQVCSWTLTLESADFSSSSGLEWCRASLSKFPAKILEGRKLFWLSMDWFLEVGFLLDLLLLDDIFNVNLKNSEVLDLSEVNTYLWSVQILIRGSKVETFWSPLRYSRECLIHLKVRKTQLESTLSQQFLINKWNTSRFQYLEIFSECKLIILR